VTYTVSAGGAGKFGELIITNFEHPPINGRAAL
jgi:hypothetical protein